MKNILITGKNSYIGNKFIEYMQGKKDYYIDVADTITDEWKHKDFSQYDTVFHVAGIAHDIKGNKKDNIYFKINCNLAFEIANRAKQNGTKQFIFMSSILIYNGTKKTIITKETIPNAKGSYAKSKLQADILLQDLQSDNFNVAIMRPPMIFGPGCKGNFPQLINFAKKTKIFPYYKNQRSMLYIDNFCEFVKLIIDNNSKGIFFPQNEDYFCTSEIFSIIAKKLNKKIYMPKLFNPLIKLGIVFSSKMQKVFGNLVYDKVLNNNKSHMLINNTDSIINCL